MLRLLAVLLILHHLTIVFCDLKSAFKFPGDDNDIEETTTLCSDVSGKPRGCHECFFCDSPMVTNKKSKVSIEKLKLTDSKCETTEVCCVQHLDLLNFNTNRFSNNCGGYNPDGRPRSRREKVRSVLPGEYPWRAWVQLKTRRDRPLCAATFISDERFVLMTSASCVQGRPPADLEVVFTKYTPTPASVDSVIVHPDFDPKTHYNDIAIIKLLNLNSVPVWAVPACKPIVAADHATPCTVVSEDDLFINAVIPLQSLCGKNVSDPSQMCALSPKGDYPAQTGAPLFCMDQYATRVQYIVYGIALYQDKEDDSVTIYTNLTHFAGWLQSHM